MWAPWVDRIHLVGFRFGFAHALARAGRTAEAAEQWRRGTVNEFRDVDRDLAWLETMALAADVSLLVGDVVRARALHELLSPYRGHIITSGVGAVCAAEHAIGVAALASGDAEAAIEQLTVAVHVADAIRAPVLRSSSLVRLAQARLARGGPDDLEHARRHVEDAIATARAHGAGGPAADAGAVLATL